MDDGFELVIPLAPIVPFPFPIPCCPMNVYRCLQYSWPKHSTRIMLANSLTIGQWFLVDGMGMSANIPKFQPIRIGRRDEDGHGLGVDWLNRREMEDFGE